MMNWTLEELNEALNNMRNIERLHDRDCRIGLPISRDPQDGYEVCTCGLDFHAERFINFLCDNHIIKKG